MWFFFVFLSPVDIHNYFKRYEVEYLQFAFRWMNNLLMRELPLRCTIRLWDTYQVEQSVFQIQLHLFCSLRTISFVTISLDEFYHFKPTAKSFKSIWSPMFMADAYKR